MSILSRQIGWNVESNLLYDVLKKLNRLIDIFGTLSIGGGFLDSFGEEFTNSTSSTIILTHSGLSGTLRLYKNGVRLSSSQFTYTGGTNITLTSPRLITDLFQADYKY